MGPFLLSTSSHKERPASLRAHPLGLSLPGTEERKVGHDLAAPSPGCWAHPSAVGPGFAAFAWTGRCQSSPSARRAALLTSFSPFQPLPSLTRDECCPAPPGLPGPSLLSLPPQPTKPLWRLGAACGPHWLSWALAESSLLRDQGAGSAGGLLRVGSVSRKQMGKFIEAPAKLPLFCRTALGTAK